MRRGRRVKGGNPAPPRRVPARAQYIRQGGEWDRTEGGFTLIELLIVIVILPLVIGAIAVALVSVFSLQGSVSNRLSDSGAAQVVSANFEKDVQSASMITTNSLSTSPSPCGSGTQVLGLVWGDGTAISYVEVPQGSSYSLVRNLCKNGITTPVSTSVVSYNVSNNPATQGPTVSCAATLAVALTSGTSYATLGVSPVPVAVVGPVGGVGGDSIVVGSGGTTQTYTAASGANPGATTLTVNSLPASSNFPIGSQVVDSSWATTKCGAVSGWISTAAVTGVTFAITEPASNFSYTLVALPGTSSPSSGLSSITAAPTTGCGFATPGTGTYASTLCFVDFSPWNNHTGSTCAGGGRQMSAGITNTSFTLTLCLSVQSKSSSGASILGSAGGGFNGVTAVPLPTYFAPPTSEAFLGNNGFYTGVPGDPALYTAFQGSTSTVTITSIKLLDSNGNPSTGWDLVTGDAESTDQGESLTWTSDQPLSLLPNSQGSSYGNACAAPTLANPFAVDLTVLPSTSVKCDATVNSDKSGTVMLEAPAPTKLTVTMVGAGLQAMFLGVLLP